MAKDSGGFLLYMGHVEGTGTEGALYTMAKESRGFLFLLLFANHVEAVEIKPIMHVIVKIEDIEAE
jgi:hypothetical protein